MNDFEIIVIAIGLAMDAFAVSLCVSESRENMSLDLYFDYLNQGWFYPIN